MRKTPGWDFATVLIVFGAFTLPAALTLRTVSKTRPQVDVALDPTPWGYTLSLLLFVVPVCALCVWFYLQDSGRLHRLPFWRTLRILVPMGIAMDVIFGNAFFTFPNQHAVSGLCIPGYDWRSGWHCNIPIEEVLFYFLGFLFVLLMYIWCDEHWLQSPSDDEYRTCSRSLDRIFKFHWKTLAIVLVLLALGFACKWHGQEDKGGFPGYFTFLVLVCVGPCVAVFGAIYRFVNWRAVLMVAFVLLFVSLIWEATLAGPYGWWGYQPEQMLGVSVAAWSGLPVEAVLVWLLGTVMTVTVFEVYKLLNAQGRLGPRHPPGP